MAQDGEAHRAYEDLAVAHVLGGLDEIDSRAFRSHLLECPDCRARVGELRAIAHELADVERDERRSRAAQTLDTKEREDGEPAERPRRHRRGRATRLLVLAGVAALLLLSVWNFTMRGTIARLQANLDRQTEAATLLEFGVPGLVLMAHPDVEGEVKMAGDRMVLLIDGLDDETVYGVYVQDATGNVVFRSAARSVDGRLLAPLQAAPRAHSLLVTIPLGGMTPDPTGTTVLHVRLPEEA